MNETVPYFLQSSQKCLLISSYACDHNIVQQIKTKQFYDHFNAKTGKNTEVNKHPSVKFWHNKIKFGAVSDVLSCNVLLNNYMGQMETHHS